MSLNTYLDTPVGRTMVISFLLAGFSFFFALLIPLSPYDPNAWYSFLYMDITLPADERMNWLLAIVEAFLLTLMYFFLVVGMGSWAELNNRLPSWGEVFAAGIITILASWLLPQIPGPETTLAEIGSSGYYHFTTNMQWAVFGFTVLGIVLSTLYIIYSAPLEE